MSRFPFVSSLGDRYIMILHHVDSNSSWSKVLKNNSKGKLTHARRRALAHMAQRGIVLRHQILNNQASFAYETDITFLPQSICKPANSSKKTPWSPRAQTKQILPQRWSGRVPAMRQRVWGCLEGTDWQVCPQRSRGSAQTSTGVGMGPAEGSETNQILRLNPRVHPTSLPPPGRRPEAG
jgi:hypothetical protein